MLSAFSMVLYYRRYRLRVMLSHLLPQKSAALFKSKLQINGVFPSLQTYDGIELIELVLFLGVFLEAYRGMYLFWAVAVHVLA